MSDSLWPHGLQHARLPCSLPSPGACSDWCPEDEMVGWHHQLWWTWVWPSSRSWWWTGKSGILQSKGWQRVRHDWAIDWTELRKWDGLWGWLQVRQGLLYYLQGCTQIPLKMHSMNTYIRACTCMWKLKIQNLEAFSSIICVRLFATPWTVARQASLSIINSWSLLKLLSMKSVMPSNHLTLCHPLLLLPSIFPSIRVFSKESILHITWPKYWSFSISPSSEYSGLISYRINWFDLLTVQGTLKSPLQHHSSKASLVLSFLYSPNLTSTHDYWKNHSFD